MKRKFGSILILVGLALLLAAAALVVKNLREQSLAEESSREVLTWLVLPQKEENPTSVPEVPDYQHDPSREMPETVIDGIPYIATLEIPALDLELPVIGTTTGEYLQKAPCRYTGSAYRENLVIGAHNYDAHFGRLKKLSYGDLIRLTDRDGNVFSYRVADIEVLQPDQVDVLTDGTWPLTLYTCTVGGQSRVTVRCEAI